MVPLAELKAYLGIASDNTDEDVQLFEMERNAVAWVQAQTQRYFGPPEQTSEILTGAAGRRLWLSEPPIANPTSGDPLATVNENAYAGASVTEYEADTDFVVRYMGTPGTPGYSAFLTRLGSASVWTVDYEYTAVYWRGYPFGKEPGDIRQLVLDLCASKRSVRSSNAEGLKSESVGGYSYTRFDGGSSSSETEIVPGAQSVIDAWKRLVFA